MRLQGANDPDLVLGARAREDVDLLHDLGQLVLTHGLELGSGEDGGAPAA